MSDRSPLNDVQAQWLSTSMDGTRRTRSLRSWLTHEEAAFFAATDHMRAAMGDADRDAVSAGLAPRPSR
jgi:hypothetical protein